MGKYVNPFTDVGFKIIFGSELSKDMLVHFLNELLRGEYEIADLTLLDKEDRGDNIRDRGVIYDIHCHTRDGKRIIVEMQNRWHSHFLDRSLYYVSRAISRQAERLGTERDSAARYGEGYKLSAVYGVFLMNFKERDLEPKFRTDTLVADRDTGRAVNANFRQVFLQFPYFTRELVDCKSLFDKWIYVLKNMHSWDRMPSALKDQVFQRLARLAEVANLSESDRVAYDKALDQYRVDQILRHDDYMEGVRKGRQEGELTGVKKVALQMIKGGLPLDAVARYTGLSPEEIRCAQEK